MFLKNFLRTCSRVTLNSTDKLKNKARSCKRVILDCDPGTDDAVALYLLLAAELRHQVKIEMITCSCGNSNLENVCRNTMRLLQTANRTDIPVYKGSVRALLPSCEPNENYHGQDGFGDLTYDVEPDMSLIRPELSFAAMRNLIVSNSKQITLIGIGPLTNIALLMRLYDDVKRHIKELYIMGGNHLGIGNVHHAAEFNFFMDPEAAHVVLGCAECPVYLLPWETCLKTRIPIVLLGGAQYVATCDHCAFQNWRMEEVGQTGGATWRLITSAERNVYRTVDYWLPCDAFLIAAMLYPELVLAKMSRHLDVELVGRLTRGQVAVDHNNTKKPNTIVFTKLNREDFQKLICDVHAAF